MSIQGAWLNSDEREKSHEGFLQEEVGSPACPEWIKTKGASDSAKNPAEPQWEFG